MIISIWYRNLLLTNISDWNLTNESILRNSENQARYENVSEIAHGIKH
jgi:hypothetical protein